MNMEGELIDAIVKVLEHKSCPLPDTVHWDFNFFFPLRYTSLFEASERTKNLMFVLHIDWKFQKKLNFTYLMDILHPFLDSHFEFTFHT